DTAIQASRSLNDQVGLRVSSLPNKPSNPSSWPKDESRRSGVFPSPRLTASRRDTGRGSPKTTVRARGFRPAAKRSIAIVIRDDQIARRFVAAARAIADIVLDPERGAATQTSQSTDLCH